VLLLFVPIVGSLLAVLPGSSVAAAPLAYHQLAPSANCPPNWLCQPLGAMRDHGRFGGGVSCKKLGKELLDLMPETSIMAHACPKRRVLALPVVS
jgi:hypothetical protein